MTRYAIRRSSGFTLIELLIVITILAVLAGAALPYVQSYVQESKVAKAKSDLDEIGRALAIYEAREGDYVKSDVSLLTGRYLNKAPIDPWGQAYFVNASAGLVVSGGPDKATSTEDDITFPYQPPLALVQAKWVDRNQTGQVDGQNSSDTLQLNFSRRVSTAVGSIVWTKIMINRNGTPVDVTAAPTLLTAAPAVPKWLASKTLVLEVAKNSAFTPGSDSIIIYSGSALTDLAGNAALTDQPVVILPQ